MLWDVKHAIHNQIWDVWRGSTGEPPQDYVKALQAVYFWRNKFRDVVAELHQQTFFFYDEYLGIWYSLQKVHGALGAQ